MIVQHAHELGHEVRMGSRRPGHDDAAARIGLNRDRPLLLGNPRAQLKAMLDERRPAYEQVAAATVATDKLSPEDVADRVEAVL